MRKTRFRNSLQFANCKPFNDLQLKNANLKHNEINAAYEHPLIKAYGQWIKDKFNSGWEVYLLTFVFKQMPERWSRDQMRDQMFREITRVHGRLVTRITKKHRSPKWIPLLPHGVFALDIPQSWRKATKETRQLHLPNSGLHVHGLLAVKRVGHLKVSLDEHFAKHQHKYVIEHIHQIDVEPVTCSPAYTTGYGIKALKLRAFSSDDVLELPRSQSELTPNPPRIIDPIKDIEAATNLSSENACVIAENPALARQILKDRYDVDRLDILLADNRMRSRGYRRKSKTLVL